MTCPSEAKWFQQLEGERFPYDCPHQPPAFQERWQPPAFEDCWQPPAFQERCQPPAFKDCWQPPAFQERWQHPAFQQNWQLDCQQDWQPSFPFRDYNLNHPDFRHNHGPPDYNHGPPDYNHGPPDYNHDLPHDHFAPSTNTRRRRWFPPSHNAPPYATTQVQPWISRHQMNRSRFQNFQTGKTKNQRVHNHRSKIGRSQCNDSEEHCPPHCEQDRVWKTGPLTSKENSFPKAPNVSSRPPGKRNGDLSMKTAEEFVCRDLSSNNSIIADSATDFNRKTSAQSPHKREVVFQGSGPGSEKELKRSKDVDNRILKDSSKGKSDKSTQSYTITNTADFDVPEKSSDDYGCKNSKDNVGFSAKSLGEPMKKRVSNRAQNQENLVKIKYEEPKNSDENRKVLREFLESKLVKDPVENGSRSSNAFLKGPIENGRNALTDRTENERESLKTIFKSRTENGSESQDVFVKVPTKSVCVSENAVFTVKDRIENRHESPKNPTENGYVSRNALIKDSTKNGHEALKNSTENGHALKNATENGRMVLKDRTENGHVALKDRTSGNRRVALKNPTENERVSLKNRTENGRVALKNPSENGRVALKGTTNSAHKAVKDSEIFTLIQLRDSVSNNSKGNTFSEISSEPVASAVQGNTALRKDALQKNSEAVRKSTQNKTETFQNSSSKNTSHIMRRKSNNQILKERFKYNHKILHGSPQSSDSLKDTVEEASGSEALKDSKRRKGYLVRRDSSKPLRSGVEMIMRSPAKSPSTRRLTDMTPSLKHSPGRISKALICFVCKEVVKKCRIAEHLYFGPLRCSECGLTMDYCDSFACMIKSMGTTRGFPCLHRSLEWSRDPVHYLKRRLRKDLVKREFKCQPTLGDIVERVSAYVEGLSFLENRSPWRPAFKKLKNFLNTKASTEDPVKAGKTPGVAQSDEGRVEDQPVREKRSLHRRHSSDSRHKHRRKHHSKNHASEDAATPRPESKWHRKSIKNDMTPPVAQGCPPAELRLFESETIPQTVEEEAIIPHKEWKGDVLSVEGVAEQLEEVRISLSADGEGKTPSLLEEIHIIATGDLEEITSLTVGDLEVTGEAAKDMVNMEVIPEEVGAVETVPHNLHNAGVGAGPVVARVEEGDDLEDKIEMDVSSMGLREGEKPVDARGGAKEKPIEEKDREMDSGRESGTQEEREIKKYNLRRRKHRPSRSLFQKLNGQEKKELWEYLLPAAKAFHEHSMKEQGRESLHLTLNPEEADDELMVDILLSQTYELEELDEDGEDLAVGEHSIPEDIISQVRDAIENSLNVNRTRLLPAPDDRRLKSKPVSRPQTKRRTSKKKKKGPGNSKVDGKTSMRSKLDPMVFGKDTVEASKVHVVRPPSDGLYYVITYPSMPIPKECPMCYYRILPCMFSLNLVTGLATGRCCGCPLTIYVVQEPADPSLPRIVFETGKRRRPPGRDVSEEASYKPRPARYKASGDGPKRRRLSVKCFLKT